MIKSRINDYTIMSYENHRTVCLIFKIRSAVLTTAKPLCKKLTHADLAKMIFMVEKRTLSE